MEAAEIRCFYADGSLHTGDVIDGSLHTGDVIGEQLLQGIEILHVYMVMLAEDYVESKWLLRQLAHMVKCQAVSNGRKVILPNFCNVTVDKCQ
ncbi:hypothetical protein CRG98_026388 [Punica granatum]|uniref:TIR domain-containing protein n=1 Tax=Punica granatum TaxID=22663 RepID=A0A2I0JC65_PUNGR|nr:hypothetical protein CRG98_026388 [Punica granatum]